MKTAYYYLYYSIYTLWKKMPGKDHAFIAMAALCLLIGFNIISFMILLDQYYNITAEKGKNLIILIIIIIFISNYFIFVHNERFKEIEEKFNNATKKQQLIGSIGVIAYVFVTFFLLFLVLFYK